MQPKRIGPIPLLQGLQLDPPVGKPGGLLDVRNMEARSSHLATRRGVSLAGAVDPESRFGNAITALSRAVYPTVWGDQSIGYYGFEYATTPYTGQWVVFGIEVTVANTKEFDHLKLEYSTGNSWRPLRYIWPGRETGSELVPLENAGGKMYIAFMFPLDWREQAVSGGGTYRWLRFQPRTNSGASDTFSTLTEVANTGDLFYTTCATRDALWVPFRSGPRIATFSDESRAVSDTAILSDWSQVEAEFTDECPRPAQVQLYPSSRTAYGRPEVSMLYVPAIDRLLLAAATEDSGPWVVDVDQDTGLMRDISPANGSIDESAQERWPEVDVSDTAWQDVPTNAALGAVQALELFNQRVFVAGANSDKHTVRWSAPSEFARIMPSANEYRLTGGGGGAIVGMAAVYRTLYIFTETAVWSVHEVDPIEGEDSRMIFNLVELTGCKSKRSITVVNGAVFFLADDGIRVFDGQSSKVVTRDVSDLFDPDSEHPMALHTSQMQYAVGVYDPVEENYMLFYRQPGSLCGNNIALVMNVRTGACFLWAEDEGGQLDTDESTFAEDGRVPWGFQANAACWDARERKVFVCGMQRFCGYIDSDTDFGAPIPWSLQTHHIGLGDRQHQVLELVDVEIRRVHRDWGVNVSVIPDGRLDRKDTRLLGAEHDGITEPAHYDNLDVGVSGSALAEVENSYVPVKARYKSRGRNHRVELSGEALDYGNTPKPIEIASLSVNVLNTGRR